MSSHLSPGSGSLPGFPLTDVERAAWDLGKQGASYKLVAQELGLTLARAADLMERLHAKLYGRSRHTTWDLLDEAELAVIHALGSCSTIAEGAEALGISSRQARSLVKGIFGKWASS